ncbi:EAL and HDOD domain-containing protein [Desulfurispira natronophila]|uniref:EAL and modified HD-GYP domain-containing signal transduction protein n=1 Tax=Desulfurispira natronophila TaxID=682562 RepID=A0A7W8DGG3_9BACT|nr:EAL domain-containing protein [Desulfurispira natronophila]MBB5021329.1 EAL and modified HD-GYP domain-containing signal transduction protein [Desulfurispira natronophila]
MDDVFIARQPIMDPTQQVYGYEFLFRQGNFVNEAHIVDVNHVSARMITNIFGNFGAEHLTSGSMGFINVDRNLLMSETVEMIPQERFVLEILEDCRVDDFLLRRVDELREEGYTFALDDFEFNREYLERFRDLIPRVEYIKLEVPSVNLAELPQHMEYLKRLNIKLLAEKVETHEEFEVCRNLGFQYFQGYYFARPQIIQQKSLEPSKVAIMNLVALIRNDADNAKVVDAFRHDPHLTFLLLRFINSGAMCLRNRIESVKQAIVMIGMRQLLNWLMLLVYANPRKESLGVQDAVFQTALFRAKFMENLFALHATGNPDQRADSAFFVGVLSLVDVVFQTPKAEVLKKLNIPDEIFNAVVAYEGHLGKLLWIVMESEETEQGHVLETLQSMNLSVDTFNQAKLGAMQWMAGFLSKV